MPMFPFGRLRYREAAYLPKYIPYVGRQVRYMPPQNAPPKPSLKGPPGPSSVCIDWLYVHGRIHGYTGTF